jgi:hypothetical protein
MTDSVQLREYLGVIDHPSRPSVLPGYSRVLVGDAQSVWAQLYSPDLTGPTYWDVFTAGRARFAQVQMPAGFIPMDLAGGIVLGIWRDQFGVEYIRTYPLPVQVPASTE